MEPQTRINSLRSLPSLPANASTGISLHSHTSCSKESLQFVHTWLNRLPGLAQILAHYARIARDQHSLTLDFVAAHWRPPLQPKMAYDLEARQIAALGLNPMVSITDHDTIEAPMHLRVLPSSRHIPVSVEWTVPFGPTEFHLGIHNLPSADGAAWMRRFEHFTAAPSDSELIAILRELDSNPGVLIVFNHPVWDLHKIGKDSHLAHMHRFLSLAGNTVHALELNGLRHANENREVMLLARRTNHLMISGGDRHGLEPNANINLTAAKSFREFVDEIRVERRSHVLFMPQYERPWEQRILESTLAAVMDFPEFTEGWQRWDERTFHADRSGQMRPLSELWLNGRAPWPLRSAINLVHLGRSKTLGRTMSLAMGSRRQQPIELEIGLENVA